MKEELALDVVEGTAFGIEAGAVVIGKHPLYVVMCVLQELVVFEFLVQVLELHSFSDSVFVFVEHVVGQFFLQDLY